MCATSLTIARSFLWDDVMVHQGLGTMLIDIPLENDMGVLIFMRLES